eukprot:gb/GFBE01059367.1/.p1 GENE.gb/GFBE01059367.1/~~gb/GFBE01059367.1/.p1  ORF type:complete len:400 (+),score=85.60 gb/GFBE01059367.1/:1-1200(+)
MSGISRCWRCALLLLVPASGNLSHVTLADVDSQAVCMDGSPAGYYWKPAASEEGKSLWIVYLQGGGWCYDEASCRDRCGSPQAPYTADNKLCSSKEWPSEMPVVGLFYDESSAKLRDANKVFVHYCTSDAHMGDSSAFGWQFRGSRVVQATLKDLVGRRGLGSAQHQLLFGGGSAGARGAMVHLDFVPSMLGDAANNVEVFGFLDSPLYVDMPPYGGLGTNFPGLAAVTEKVHSFANVAHLGEECAAAYQDAPWKCMFGEYRMPYVRTPYILVASQYDSYQLGVNGIPDAPNSDDQWKYALSFANRVVDIVKSLRAKWPANATHQNAVFSWSCHNHWTSVDEAGFNKKTCSPGSTMEGAVQQFLGFVPATTTPSFQWIDTCYGFSCGSGCNMAAAELVV